MHLYTYTTTVLCFHANGLFYLWSHILLFIYLRDRASMCWFTPKNAQNRCNWARPNPGAGHPIHIPHRDGGNPATHSYHCCHQGSSTNSKLESRAAARNQTHALHLECRNPIQEFNHWTKYPSHVCNFLYFFLNLPIYLINLSMSINTTRLPHFITWKVCSFIYLKLRITNRKEKRKREGENL